MKKRILYIENDIEEYEFLYERLNPYYDIFPKPEDFRKTILMCLQVIAEPTKFTVKLIRLIRSINPELIIIDVALMTKYETTRNDFTGGELRRGFLAHAFPKIPVIFISGHRNADLQPYYVTGDRFVAKFNYGTYPNDAVIPDLREMIDKLNK